MGSIAPPIGMDPMGSIAPLIGMDPMGIEGVPFAQLGPACPPRPKAPAVAIPTEAASEATDDEEEDPRPRGPAACRGDSSCAVAAVEKENYASVPEPRDTVGASAADSKR